MTRLHSASLRPAGPAFRAHRAWSLVTAGLVLALAGIGLTCPARPARAEDGLPKGEALIQKMIDATGGKAAYDKLQSQFTKGKLTVTAKKTFEMNRTVWSQRPNKSYTLLESKARGRTESVCDGTTVWETAQLGGPSLKNGPERALQVRRAEFDQWTNWTKYYKSATTVGADSVAGKTVWKVEMVPFEGFPETMWLDQTTGLLLKTSTRLMGDNGAVPAEIYVEDYIEACGIKIPSRTRMVSRGGLREVVTTVDSVACNPEAPNGLFDMPGEIKALLDKSNAAEAPAGKNDEKDKGIEKGEGKN